MTSAGSERVRCEAKRDGRATQCLREAQYTATNGARLCLQHCASDVPRVAFPATEATAWSYDAMTFDVMDEEDCAQVA